MIIITFVSECEIREDPLNYRWNSSENVIRVDLYAIEDFTGDLKVTTFDYHSELQFALKMDKITRGQKTWFIYEGWNIIYLYQNSEGRLGVKDSNGNKLLASNNSTLPRLIFPQRLIFKGYRYIIDCYSGKIFISI